MFGVRYVKVCPNTYLIHSVNGKVRREGTGLSFFYFAPWSNLVAIPVGSEDIPFVFNIATADFQAVTIQGQLTYRIAEPRHLAELLDYSVDGEGKRLSDDHEKLQQRLIHATQVLANGVAGRLSLYEALVGADEITKTVLEALKESDVVAMLGLEVLGLMLLSVKATPEMARALEAEAREALQRKADDAIHARRQHALEQERTLTETELATRKAVEEKEREIRKASLEGDITAENQRKELIDHQAQNERTAADAKAYALEACLKPVREMDARKLAALAMGSADPGASIAMAFQELAENASQIGELNISPELLSGLLDRSKKGRASRKNQ